MQKYTKYYLFWEYASFSVVLGPTHWNLFELLCLKIKWHVQKRSVRVSRVSPANTLKKKRKIKLSVLLSWFSSSSYGTHRTDQINKMHRYPSPVSQTSTLWLTTPSWLKLANNAIYLIGSAVFCCMQCHWSAKVRQIALFFVFQSVGNPNTVKQDAPPLVIIDYNPQQTILDTVYPINHCTTRFVYWSVSVVQLNYLNRSVTVPPWQRLHHGGKYLQSIGNTHKLNGNYTVNITYPIRSSLNGL